MDGIGCLSPLPTDDDVLIAADKLPGYIGVARQTLARWRTEGHGPAFVKVGRLVVYRVGDVRQWLRERTYAHTTQAQSIRPDSDRRRP
jgi:predicted DNA-binding transcriptional regulator AlpA